MLDLKLALSVAAGVCGLLSAWWWWRASTMKLRTVASLPPGLGDGDVAYQVGHTEFIHWRVADQSRLNSWAAVAAALAVALPVVRDWLPVAG